MVSEFRTFHLSFGEDTFVYNLCLLCSDILGDYWTDSPVTVLPIYQELIAAGLRIWVFRCHNNSFFFFLHSIIPFCLFIYMMNQPSLCHSGNADSVVPVSATRRSLDALKLPTITNWHPWYDNKKVFPPFSFHHFKVSKVTRSFFYHFCCWWKKGWWMEPSIQGTYICNHKWSWTWGTTSSAKTSFYTFQSISGKQGNAELNLQLSSSIIKNRWTTLLSLHHRYKNRNKSKNKRENFLNTYYLNPSIYTSETNFWRFFSYSSQVMLLP